MAFLAELWSLLWTRRQFWLLPILIVILCVAGLLLIASKSGVSLREPLVPMSSDHYRHDGAFSSR